MEATSGNGLSLLSKFPPPPPHSPSQFLPVLVSFLVILHQDLIQYNVNYFKHPLCSSEKLKGAKSMKTNMKFLSAEVWNSFTSVDMFVTYHVTFSLERRNIDGESKLGRIFGPDFVATKKN